MESLLRNIDYDTILLIVILNRNQIIIYIHIMAINHIQVHADTMAAVGGYDFIPIPKNATHSY